MPNQILRAARITRRGTENRLDRFIIQGGTPLQGRIAVSGSKNSALPALAAALLTSDPVVLDRVPAVRDIRTMLELIRHTGAEVSAWKRHRRVTIQAREIVRPEAPYELVKTMRASSLVLGPLVARCGRARVSLPGGCAIGARPINLHVAGLEQLGAEVRQEHGYIEAVAPAGSEGRRSPFRPHHGHRHRGSNDGGRAGAAERRVIDNAAREPEVVDLARLLDRHGRGHRGRGNLHHSRSRRRKASRRGTHHHRRPH